MEERAAPDHASYLRIEEREPVNHLPVGGLPHTSASV